MIIGSKSFQELKNEKDFGFVVMGAGKPWNKWISGIEEILKEKNIVDKNVETFSNATLAHTIRM